MRVSDESSEKVITERALASWEIASVVASILITEWVVLSLADGSKLIAAIPVGTVFVFMFISHRLHSESLRDIGIRMDNFIRALRAIALPTIVAVVLILVIGWFAGGARVETLLSRPRYLLLPLWALAQQYVTQGFLNRRAQIVFGKGWRSVLVVASIFALLHMPNLHLVWLTFIGGAVWAGVYQIAPNLFALAISHTITAMLLAKAVPPGWLNSLRVGVKYFL